MSHEIRTPLNAIMGYSQILERSQGLTDQQKNDIVAIYRSGKHLLSIINDILDFSKIEAGKMELHLIDFDLESLIQDLFVIFTMRCQEKKLNLNIEGFKKDEKVFVRSDSVKLRQILVNLIGNAVKFTTSGSVTLTVTPLENDSYYFAVRDTGSGIPLEKQDSIFKAFKQDEEGIKQGGTGLGLSISKTLLQLLGSDLSMDSIPEQGSCFYFTVKLPASKISKDLEENPYTKVRKLAGGHTIRAILIDDIQANVDVLARVLHDIGAESISANNGSEGLALIDEFSPDIVFTDYHMKGMDGLEVTRRIRKEFGNKNIKVVMISASVFDHHQKMYREEGVDGFIGKPFIREEIFELMVQLLNVEYEYSEVTNPRPRAQRSLGLDISSIRLPQELLDDLKNAAQSGRVSKVHELLDYLNNEKLVAKNLIQHLKDLTNNLDLDSVFGIICEIQAGNPYD